MKRDFEIVSLKELSDSFFSSEKKESFKLSREALKRLLENEGLKVEKEDQLEITNHLYLSHFPSYAVSLSHTKNFGGAFIKKRSEVCSIGIDLEFVTRKISENTLKFFINSKDEFQNPLILWTQKEAAFKALSPLFNFDPLLTLKSIIVQKNLFFLEEKSDIQGRIKTETIQKFDEKLYVSFAEIKNKEAQWKI